MRGGKEGRRGGDDLFGGMMDEGKLQTVEGGRGGRGGVCHMRGGFSWARRRPGGWPSMPLPFPCVGPVPASAGLGWGS